jgi:hypothetical protein
VEEQQVRVRAFLEELEERLLWLGAEPLYYRATEELGEELAALATTLLRAHPELVLWVDRDLPLQVAYQALFLVPRLPMEEVVGTDQSAGAEDLVLQDRRVAPGQPEQSLLPIV